MGGTIDIVDSLTSDDLFRVQLLDIHSPESIEEVKMTLNLSGGREPRLLWGISGSNVNPSDFLGGLADDPAVANLLKNSTCPISLSATTPGVNGTTEAIKVLNGGSSEHRQSSFNADDLLNTSAQCESRGGVSRTTTSRDTARSPMEAGCATTTRMTNGWPTYQRPQTLLQNGLSIPPAVQQVRMQQQPSPVNSAHPSLTSPLHPPPTYHTPSPHSTTPPGPTRSHSPHYLHRSNSSAASSPTTPTNESCSNTTSSRTQPVAPSPFIATRLPSSIPVNMLTQISNYDLVDTMVTLKSTSRDVIMHGQVGVVKRVTTGDTASVHLLSTSSDIHVPCSSLEPVKPRQKDVVKVIGGTHCLGRIGTLMSVIGEHGIVKFMRGDNIAQIPLRNLGKYAPTRESGVKAVDYLMKSASSANSSSHQQQQQSLSSKEVSESSFSSVNNSTTAATTNFPFVALHYPGAAFPFLIPGASPRGGSYVSLSGTTIFPSSGTATSDITENSSPYSSARIFPSMISPFMMSPSHSETNSSNGMVTRNGLNSHSGSTSSDQLNSLFPSGSLSFMYPPAPMVARGRTIKTDVTSPTEATTPFSSNGRPTPSFSFVRQDSTERDSVQQRPIPAPDDLLRPSNFHPSQQHSSRSGRPSVIQSSSNHSGADPKQQQQQYHSRGGHKGLLQPSSAIEKAKAFMATAMGVCPPANRGGGGGVASPMTRVQQDGQLVSGDGRAPPPYPTSAKLGGRVSGSGHDHRNNHQVKMNPEEKIKHFIEKLVQNRRSYAYRRNSGEGDVKTSCIRISLICPLSQKRMSYPCRGNTCRHHQCFDADAYVRYNIAQKVKKKLMKQPNGKSCVLEVVNKKWQCPICHSNVVANQLYIDKDIFTAVRESSAQEVELGDEGSWRPVQKEEKKIEVIDLTDLDD